MMPAKTHIDDNAAATCALTHHARAVMAHYRRCLVDAESQRALGAVVAAAGGADAKNALEKQRWRRIDAALNRAAAVVGECRRHGPVRVQQGYRDRERERKREGQKNKEREREKE